MQLNTKRKQNDAEQNTLKRAKCSAHLGDDISLATTVETNSTRSSNTTTLSAGLPITSTYTSSYRLQSPTFFTDRVNMQFLPPAQDGLITDKEENAGTPFSFRSISTLTTASASSHYTDSPFTAVCDEGDQADRVTRSFFIQHEQSASLRKTSTSLPNLHSIKKSETSLNLQSLAEALDSTDDIVDKEVAQITDVYDSDLGLDLSSSDDDDDELQGLRARSVPSFR